MPSPPAAAHVPAARPPAGATPDAVTFEATAEGGVIRVPETVRAQLGPSFRVLVSVPPRTAGRGDPDVEPADLGDLEGTPMAAMMRDPLSTPDGRYLTREERNARE